jgi:hypothetical protein
MNNSNNDESDIRDADKSYKERLLDDDIDLDDDDLEDEELQLVIEMSNNEYFSQIENISIDECIEESIQLYDKQIEINKQTNINNRIDSLKNFTNKIKLLRYTEKDIVLKNYIDSVLEKYFKLEIDYIKVEDPDLFNELYKLIDSYYLEPFKKNYKKFAISQEEDIILRKIFIRNN